MAERRLGREIAGASLAILAAVGAAACTGDNDGESASTTLSFELRQDQEVRTTFESEMSRLIPQIAAIQNDQFGFTDPAFDGEAGLQFVGVWGLSYIEDGTITITTKNPDGSIWSTSVGLQGADYTDSEGVQHNDYGYGTVVKKYDTEDGFVTVGPLNLDGSAMALEVAFSQVDRALENIRGRYTAEQLAQMHDSYIQGR